MSHSLASTNSWCQAGSEPLTHGLFGEGIPDARVLVYFKKIHERIFKVSEQRNGKGFRVWICLSDFEYYIGYELSTLQVLIHSCSLKCYFQYA